jgi:hypothetical protein
MFSNIVGRPLINSSYRIFASSSSIKGYKTTPKMFGFFPDIYAEDKRRSMAIIGEAKTSEDICNKHTEDQFIAYIRFIKPFKKKFIFLQVEESDFYGALLYLKPLFKNSSVSLIINNKSA